MVLIPASLYSVSASMTSNMFIIVGFLFASILAEEEHIFLAKIEQMDRINYRLAILIWT
jgi:hypothetical protein